MKKVGFSASVIFLFIFSGCGGGGGGGSSETAPTQPTVTQQESTPSSRDMLQIVDASSVASLKIVCKKEKLLSDENGEFECKSTPIEFYLGELHLGTLKKIPHDGIIYPQDIVGVARGATAHPEVTKISMILESLDSDAKPSNGISLLPKKVEEFNSYSQQYKNLAEINFEELTYMLEQVSSLVVSAKDAQVNLTSRVSQAPARTYEQRITGRTK